MTSGVPNQSVKDHWKRQADGTYVSNHPKYDGMRIEQISKNEWLLHLRQQDSIRRPSLMACKSFAYHEANWWTGPCLVERV